MPTFDEYTINIDISSLSGDDIEKAKYTSQYNMLKLKSVKRYITNNEKKL